MRVRSLVPAVLVAAALAAAPTPVSAAPSPLQVSMLTWNVLGLDSNDPTTGPYLFPVGARVCNRGSARVSGVTAELVLGSASTLIAPLGPTSLAKGSLAPGSCVDAYFAVTVSRVKASYEATRGIRVVARATDVPAVSTPSPRELHVERLISQNRNQVHSITGPTTVYVGQTYRYTLVSETAPGGYEQLESHINLNPAQLELLDVDTRYGAPAGATNDSVYADACGWDDVPTSGTYLSCIGPAGYPGGKAGDSITTTYTVRVRAVGQSVLTGVIYDKSGSSYHYNTDYDTAGNRLVVNAVLPPDLAVSKTHATSPWSPGGTGTWTIRVRNVGGSPTVGTTTVSDTLPVGTTPVSATGSGWSCQVGGRTVTCTRTTPIAAGASSSIALLVKVAADAPSSLVNTVRVTTAHDPTSANNTDTDTVAVVRPAAPVEAEGSVPGGRRPALVVAAGPQPAVAPPGSPGSPGTASPRLRQPSGPLPSTGAPVVELARAGAGALLLGVVLLCVGLPRRRPLTAEPTASHPRARR